MASFGSGFSRGLRTGTLVGSAWANRYEDAQEKEVENKLFTAALKLQQEGQQRDAEGNIINEISNMSPSDISNSIMQQAMAGGMKMTDDVARLAMGVGQQIFGGIQDYKVHQQKNQIFQKKMQNMNSIIAKRNQIKSTQEKVGGTKSAADAIAMDMYGVPYMRLKSSGRKTVNKILYEKPTAKSGGQPKLTTNQSDYEYAKKNPGFASTHMIDVPEPKRKPLGRLNKPNGKYTDKSGKTVEVIDGIAYEL